MAGIGHFFVKMFYRGKSKNIDFLKLYGASVRAFNEIPFVKRRGKNRLIFKFFKIFTWSFIVFFILIIAVGAINFLNIKTVYSEAITGKENIDYALVLFKEKKYEQSARFSELAENNFANALERFSAVKNSFYIKNFDFISKQLDDFYSLLSAANILSGTLNDTANFALSFNEYLDGRVSFTSLPKFQKIRILDTLYFSESLLERIRDNLDLAFAQITKAQSNVFLSPLRNKLLETKSAVYEARQFAEKAVPLVKLLPEFLGYPEKSSFLLVLQNSDELRPTGGFIGTYGIFELENGDMVRNDTHDIYHMDMPVKDLVDVSPPEPLKKYLNAEKWYMRDSNWSPDWPTSAKRIEWFYKTEDKLLPPQDRINNFSGDFDGVIGITPELIIDLLKITGSVIIEGEEYNSNNFVDLLQYRVEKSYVQLGVPSWQRKKVIGEIVKELKSRLFNLSPEALYDAGNVFFENLLKKNIVVYLHDKEKQQIILDQDWGGAISDVKSDYVFVVDANLAAFKTDRVMNRGIEYKIDQGVNGAFAELTVNYKHNGEGFDWRTTRYRTYTRIYTPINSSLISVEGFNDESIEIYSEFGKTVFAGFLSIEPGEFGRIKLRYKLNDDIYRQIKNGEYNLVFQKQPGNKVESLRIDLMFNNRIKLYSPVGFYAKGGSNTVSWDSGLETDRVFGVKLER
ncbi:DUF4012 domain-containing protein [Candidatus Parcubacteria bacterium]|nr:DUF4012 domain-containing protein [Candidatus Parcubacteria bacterium]